MIRDFIDLEIRDGVAVLWLDEQGRAVNTISPNALDALEEAIDTVERDDSVRAAVLISRKNDAFVAGADLDVLRDAETPQDAAQMSRRGHLLIRRVETLRKPLVAAIHGAALGGGLELALAADYRVATEHKSTRFALPEVQLGLLPGGGGTQLLPRLIGLQEALPMLLIGKTAFPRKAKKIGLIDLLTHRDALLRTAIQAAHDLAAGRIESSRKRGVADRLLDTALGRKVVYRKALQQIESETGGNYPAPPAILACVQAGLEDGIEAGFHAESDYFGRLVFTPQHKALVGIFRAKQRADKNRFEGAREVDTLGVLGAGLMGSGIAQVSAEKGVMVHVKDVSLEQAATARKAVWKALQKKADRKQISAFEADTTLERIRATADYAALDGADVVIEAVPENLDLKRTVFADLEAVVSDDAVLASNTSALPISEIAAQAKHPERFLGMHYFSPVPQRPLLEIIRTEQTSEAALATAVALGQRQGQSVIVVKDGPGFYTTRILAVYLNEAALMLEEGADAETVDAALRDWGFPMGPFELMDFVGLDVGAKVTPVLSERLAGRDLPTSDAAQHLVDAGRLGQKSGKGFYVYSEKKKGRPEREAFDKAVYAYFGGPERKPTDRRAAQERLGLVMVNEAVRCLEEGILETASDGDLGAVFGLGFPPFRGGPFMMIDLEGANSVASRLERLAERHGPRFAPAALLAEHARTGEPFRS